MQSPVLQRCRTEPPDRRGRSSARQNIPPERENPGLRPTALRPAVAGGCRRRPGPPPCGGGPDVRKPLFSGVRTRDSRERPRILGRPRGAVNRPALGRGGVVARRTPIAGYPPALRNPRNQCRCGCVGTRLRNHILLVPHPQVRTCVTGWGVVPEPGPPPCGRPQRRRRRRRRRGAHPASTAPHPRAARAADKRRRRR